jgi:hypothetical protein
MNHLKETMITEALLTRGEDPVEDDGIVRQIVDAIRSVRLGQVQITFRIPGLSGQTEPKK